jgi:hypothetical protein
MKAEPDGSYVHKDGTPYPKMTRRGPGLEWPPRTGDGGATLPYAADGSAPTRSATRGILPLP